MASAAAQLDTGTEIPGEEHVETTTEVTERDFEAEAREHGWVPKDDFKGDASRWVDAETFMKRADDMMPLLKATNARLKRELETIKKDLRKATAHFEGAEKRAYDRAYAELEKKLTEATEAGDTKTALATAKEMQDLKPTTTESWREGKSDAEVKELATEALSEFRERNAWYDKANLASATETEQLGRIYYDQQIDKNIKLTETMPPSEFFAHIEELTKQKYPQLFEKAPREKPVSAVAGVTGGRPRGSSKSWDNLPQEAKRQFERWQKNGILGVKPSGDKDKDLAASRTYYAKTFDWEGYQQ